jgi:hypothetical protein
MSPSLDDAIWCSTSSDASQFSSLHILVRIFLIEFVVTRLKEIYKKIDVALREQEPKSQNFYNHQICRTTGFISHMVPCVHQHLEERTQGHQSSTLQYHYSLLWEWVSDMTVGTWVLWIRPVKHLRSLVKATLPLVTGMSSIRMIANFLWHLVLVGQSSEYFLIFSTKFSNSSSFDI